MDADDQMDQVYEGLVHWADAVVLALAGQFLGFFAEVGAPGFSDSQEVAI